MTETKMPERGAIQRALSELLALSAAVCDQADFKNTLVACESAESELAALEAAVVAIRTQLTAEVKENADLRAQLAAAEEDKSLKESAYVQMRAERDYWVGLCRAKKDDVQALMDRLNRIAESE